MTSSRVSSLALEFAATLMYAYYTRTFSHPTRLRSEAIRSGESQPGRHLEEFLHRMHRNLTTLGGGVGVTQARQPRRLWLTAVSALAAAFSLIPPASAASAGPTASGCRVSDVPERTVEILRFHCDQSQLDLLYE